MVTYNDLFVAGVAFVGGGLSLAISVGPWPAPYELRTMAAIRDRYGMAAARATWMLIALASILAGVAIATGLRPSYARPTTDSGLRGVTVITPR
ncbi:MAG: hypothetical protein AAFX06_20990 [Planctomycetota bacterium]